MNRYYTNPTKLEVESHCILPTAISYNIKHVYIKQNKLKRNKINRSEKKGIINVLISKQAFVLKDKRPSTTIPNMSDLRFYVRMQDKQSTSRMHSREMYQM